MKTSSLHLQGSALITPSTHANAILNTTISQRVNLTQHNSPSPTSQSHPRAYNQTTTAPPHINADVSHITSIIISKDVSGQKVTVASVTAFDNTSIEDPFTGIVSVEGDSNRSPVAGEQGYLQLTWEEPVAREAGVYTCEVFGLNTDKHPVSLYGTVHVLTSEPTYSELIAYISAFDKAVSSFKEENIKLNSTVS